MKLPEREDIIVYQDETPRINRRLNFPLPITVYGLAVLDSRRIVLQEGEAVEFDKLIGTVVQLGTDNYYLHEYDAGAQRVRGTRTDRKGIFLERGSVWINVEGYLDKPQPNRLDKVYKKSIPE